MKKRWEGGWDECSRLKELEVRPLSLFSPSFLTLLSTVPSSNSVSRKYYSSLRLFSAPHHEGALFRIRIYGREPLPSHQGAKRPAIRRGTRGVDFQADCVGVGPHPRSWVFSPGHETRKRPCHNSRPVRLHPRIPHCATQRFEGEGCRRHHQAGRFRTGARNEQQTSIHGICVHKMVSCTRSPSLEPRILKSCRHVGVGDDYGGAGESEAPFSGLRSS